MSVFMMSSSIVWPPGPAVTGAAVGRELHEPEVVLGWSTVDYARSTSVSPNTEMRPRIPGDPAPCPAPKFAQISAAATPRRCRVRVLRVAVRGALRVACPEHTALGCRAARGQLSLEDLVGRRGRQPVGEPHVPGPRLG